MAGLCYVVLGLHLTSILPDSYSPQKKGEFKHGHRSTRSTDNSVAASRGLTPVPAADGRTGQYFISHNGAVVAAGQEKCPVAVATLTTAAPPVLVRSQGSWLKECGEDMDQLTFLTQCERLTDRRDN